MKKLIVNHKYNGKKLNIFLLENVPNLSSNLLYKTLRKKDIKVNGKRVSENITVYEKTHLHRICKYSHIRCQTGCLIKKFRRPRKDR